MINMQIQLNQLILIYFEKYIGNLIMCFPAGHQQGAATYWLPCCFNFMFLSISGATRGLN